MSLAVLGARWPSWGRRVPKPNRSLDVDFPLSFRMSRQERSIVVLLQSWTIASAVAADDAIAIAVGPRESRRRCVCIDPAYRGADQRMATPGDRSVSLTPRGEITSLIAPTVAARPTPTNCRVNCRLQRTILFSAAT